MMAGLFFLSAGLGFYHWAKHPKTQMHHIMGDWWLPYAAFCLYMGIAALNGGVAE